MSILIKGMEMPHDCLECYVAQFCKEYQDEENKRPYGCPLVEIPPHDRLIGIALGLLDKYRDAEFKNIHKQGGAITKKLWVLEQECAEIYCEIMRSEEQENETN